MTTATKSLAEMTTGELIQWDIKTSDELERCDPSFQPQFARNMLRQRQTIRAELERRKAG